VPALRALADDFEIAGVANTSRASAEAAAAAMGLPRAFDDVAEVVGSAEVDIVAVTVKVPYHKAIVTAAIESGKHVYCEWPLGNGLQEARELGALARQRGVHAVAGTVARSLPACGSVRFMVPVHWPLTSFSR
jgi:predicted dehydrogenase